MKTSELEHLQSAMITAWVRAIESKKEDRLFDDPYAEQLSNRPNLEFLCARTRLFDDELLKTVSSLKGLCQIVILGAGMDTRALRLKELSSIPVFEIDLPLIVTTKNNLMTEHQMRRDDYARIEADLEEDDWPDLLKQKGFHQSVPTIWIAEGFITYLDADKSLELLKKMYVDSALGSVVIADIPDQSASGKNQRIRFTCDDPEKWFAKTKWQSVTSIEPEDHSKLRSRFESVNQQIRIFRTVKQKTVLIIGCGYFGGQLLEKLRGSEKYQLLATTSTEARTDALIEQGAREALVLDGGEDVIEPFIDKADVVVISIRSPSHDNAKILTVLKKVAPTLKPSQHLIYISSVEVYPGEIQAAKEEDGSPEKIQFMMEDVFASHPWKCIPRIAQLCGPGQDHRGFSKNMKGHLEKVMALTKGLLPGDGKQPVHLTHVQDLVAFVKYAIETDLKGTFNLCKTLGCDRKKFYEILCDHYQTKQVEWSQSMEGVRHMMLPKQINTDNLDKLDFSLNERHYKMNFFLNE